MFRRWRRRRRWRRTFPHASGDVPCLILLACPLPRFSPREWGCSGLCSCIARQYLLFPTRVGMFRRRRQSRRCGRTFPHASGDVPTWGIRGIPSQRFSPREWGCSDGGGKMEELKCLFPTRVGMFRTANTRALLGLPFPHASGDVPLRGDYKLVPDSFSPREWGCSARPVVQHRWQVLFPTRVGMFRSRSRRNTRRSSFPHASGDVPGESPSPSFRTIFSPREWGCSGPCKIS